MNTRVRTALPALLITAATVLGVGAAVPAVAASAVAARTAPSLQQPLFDGQDVYRGWYFSKETCRDAGDAGVTAGHWDNYSCRPGRGGILHHLWTNR
ncbi:hypothetical protein [Streptomyces abikoensis]|uniref:hypothetical protein n=1 Tax=Streptomyces abikoensis TaxID=97398 RepID=UPI001673EBB4|nr:hypothetical protein [Streptomyces abikoensis]GGP47290.1 hypothetical protein GCM10010214_20580 [Streptomyces abikoensis]